MPASIVKLLGARRWAVLTALAAAAVATNVCAPTVFFDVQIMLGASLGVYAILQFGWPGIVVGIASLMVTLVRWQHPFELLIGSAHLVWLKVFLDRFNGDWERRDNGRIVLASIAFWLLVGLPCELLHFTQYFGLGLVKAVGLGLKECVTGVINASLGLVLFLCARQGGSQAISARGAAFATVLVAAALPGIFMTMTLSGHLRTAALESSLGSLRQAADKEVARLVAGELPSHPHWGIGSGVAVEVRAMDGTIRSSDPALFHLLGTDFELEVPSRTGVPGLDILAPKGSLPAARVEQVCYWSTSLDAPIGWETARAVQPAPHVIGILDHKLLVPLFSTLLALQILAASCGEIIGTFTDRQFRSVLEPARRQPESAAMPTLGTAAIYELNQMVDLINGHSLRVNELTTAVAGARKREKEAEEHQRVELRNKLKTSLTAAAIAHEINLPLSNILLGSKMAAQLLDSLGQRGECLRPVLSGLAEESERVVTTISRMRMLLRSVQTELSPVDPVNAVHNALMQVEEEFAAKAIRLHTHIAETPCVVMGDAGQLQIAITNLLRNAADAVASTPAENRQIDVAVVRQHADALEIVVGDSGPGMTLPEAVGEPLASTKPDGSGLGLFVVRTIVENHGGGLHVGHSALGGAEFRMRLRPFDAAQASPESSH